MLRKGVFAASRVSITGSTAPTATMQDEKYLGYSAERPLLWETTVNIGPTYTERTILVFAYAEQGGGSVTALLDGTQMSVDSFADWNGTFSAEVYALRTNISTSETATLSLSFATGPSRVGCFVVTVDASVVPVGDAKYTQGIGSGTHYFTPTPSNASIIVGAVFSQSSSSTVDYFQWEQLEEVSTVEGGGYSHRSLAILNNPENSLNATLTYEGYISTVLMSYGLSASSTSGGLIFLAADKVSTTTIQLPFGAESPDRVLVAAVGRRVASGGNISSITIGGVPATIDIESTTWDTVAIARALVPTGTSGDIVITVDGETNGDRSAALFCGYGRLVEPVNNGQHYSGSTELSSVTLFPRTGSTVVSSIFSSSPNTQTENYYVWNTINEILDKGTTNAHASAAYNTVTTSTAISLEVTSVDALYQALAAAAYVVVSEEEPTPPYLLDSRLLELDASTIAGTNGDPVSTWGSGYGITGVSTLSATDPVLETGDFTFPAVRFNGTNLMRAVSGSLDSSQTTFAVVRPNESTTNTTVVGVSSGTGWGLRINSLVPQAFSHGGDWATASGPASPINEWSVISGRYHRGISYQVRSNGVSGVLGATTTLSTPDRRVDIGGNAGSPSFVGEIAEVLHFRRALTDEEWIGIESYLMNKYGIT